MDCVALTIPVSMSDNRSLHSPSQALPYGSHGMMHQMNSGFNMQISQQHQQQHHHQAPAPPQPQQQPQQQQPAEDVAPQAVIGQEAPTPLYCSEECRMKDLQQSWLAQPPIARRLLDISGLGSGSRSGSGEGFGSGAEGEEEEFDFCRMRGFRTASRRRRSRFAQVGTIRAPRPGCG